MSTTGSVLYRDLPKESLEARYPNAKDKLPFTTGNYYTAFPQDTALIQTTALVALAIISYFKPAIFIVGSSYMILHSYVFPPKTDPWYPGAAAFGVGTIARFAVDSAKLSWVASLATLVYAAWTAYSNIYREDALVNSFYQIAGSKEKFEKLPELPKISEAKSVQSWMDKTDWNKLYKPVYRAKTADERQILIVRTCKRDDAKDTFVPNTLGVEVYIEKYDQQDNDPTDTSYGRKMIDALLTTQNSTFSYSSKSSESTFTLGDRTVHTASSLKVNLRSHITAERANELFAQLA
ncbi:hypothetical protein [Simkania sp.]|uniref:hypothetical protein n=1 Tax=Simkania sp. TaxID=34094 RepID=UPI003B522485